VDLENDMGKTLFYIIIPIYSTGSIVTVRNFSRRRTLPYSTFNFTFSRQLWQKIWRRKL
jgi:hypothetical protein